MLCQKAHLARLEFYLIPPAQYFEFNKLQPVPPVFQKYVGYSRALVGFNSA